MAVADAVAALGRRDSDLNGRRRRHVVAVVASSHAYSHTHTHTRARTLVRTHTNTASKGQDANSRVRTTRGGDCGEITGTGTAANENNCAAAAVDEIALAV